MSIDGWRPTRRAALQGLLATGAGLRGGPRGLRRGLRAPSDPARAVGSAHHRPAAGARRTARRAHHRRPRERDGARRRRAHGRAAAGRRRDPTWWRSAATTSPTSTRRARCRPPTCSRRSRGAARALAVLGNHDDDRVVPAALVSRGFTVLKDARTRLTIRGETVDIAGLRYWTRRVSDIASVLHGAGPTTILLAHDPRRLREAASLDVQLVLAGHTHGGQVVLPGLGAIAARRFPGRGRSGHRGQLHAVRQPRRRHRGGAGAHQLPAGSLGADAPQHVVDLSGPAPAQASRKRRPSTRQPPASTRATAAGNRPMLLDQDARRQRVGGVVGSTGTAACATIGPASSSAVTRCTVQPATLTPCATACPGASMPGKRRQQRRVDVQHRPVEHLQEPRREPSHEAGQAHQVHASGRAAPPPAPRRRPHGVGQPRCGSTTRLDARRPRPGRARPRPARSR